MDEAMADAIRKLKDGDSFISVYSPTLNEWVLIGRVWLWRDVDCEDER